jgi:uncharacterized protein YcbK (DUF882 family)
MHRRKQKGSLLMNRSLAWYFTWLMLLVLIADTAWGQTTGEDVSRFFFSGDGKIRMISEKNGKGFNGSYRMASGGYDQTALKAICEVFQAPCATGIMSLSLRLIEFIDLLQDRLSPDALITIVSGYRSPEYNTRIRNRGGLAAKASLHQYGMAADLKIDGVPARDVWNYVKALGFGGAGYYHGDSLHIDVGPARSWDETTSGVGTGISDDNKLIGLVTDYDVYLPGETMTLRFIRMTAFPIGVSEEFALIRGHEEQSSGQGIGFKPVFTVPPTGTCPKFDNIDQMAGIRWRLPDYLPEGRYTVHARFCGNPWIAMPPETFSPEIEIIGKGRRVKHFP